MIARVVEELETACDYQARRRAIIGTRPVTDEELARAKAQSIRALPGSFETTRSVLGVLVGNALYTRADDYVTTLKAKYEAQTDADIEAAAKQIIQPDALTWVIVGDLKKIEQPLRALKLGEVSVLTEELTCDHTPMPSSRR